MRFVCASPVDELGKVSVWDLHRLCPERGQGKDAPDIKGTDQAKQDRIPFRPLLCLTLMKSGLLSAWELHSSTKRTTEDRSVRF